LANTNDFLQIKTDVKAENVEKENELFKVTVTGGEKFETKTILITTGSGRRKLIAKNADTLEHKGLTYCASCDGPLFADMDVAVIGGGNAAFESAAQLLAYCKSVTLINRSDTFRADEITMQKVLENPKMKVIKNAEILEVKGEKFVEGLIYKPARNASGIADAGGDKDGEHASPVGLQPRELAVSGIFVEIGQIPNTDFVKNLLPLDKIGRIKIDAWSQKTEVPGIWAAGDCTNVLYHQNNIAAGDAVRALEDIYVTLKTR
jgi:thioredoxin reductase